jgi:hypothetical protein
MSGRPNESLYYTSQESLYPRARRPPPQAPNNVGLVLVGMMLVAIVVTLALVGPELLGQVRHIVYCMNHAQEAAC